MKDWLKIMRNKRQGLRLIVCLIFFLPQLSKSQPLILKKENGLEYKSDSTIISIVFITDNVVRICKQPIGREMGKSSFSVIQQPQKVKFDIKRTGNIVQVKSKSLDIELALSSGKLSFYNVAGTPLLSEQNNGALFSKDSLKHLSSVKQSFSLSPQEAIYGLGQHQTGKLNQRHQKILLQQQNMEIAIPYFYSTKGYGLFWNNASTTVFKDDSSGTSFSSAVGDCIDYYIIRGRNAYEALARWRRLTGEAPMFPRWAFGYWQSKERYQSQGELLNVVKRYRALNIPLDAIVQDWRYWGMDWGQWNATEFGNPKYPHPKEMIDSVHDLNAHFVISVWPSFGTKTKIYEELNKGQMLYHHLHTWPTDSVAVYDAFNPQARDIYWKYINKNIFSKGADGWWLDATEPIQKSVDSNVVIPTYSGSFKSVRNAYPIETVGGVFIHQRQATTDKRAVILTRSCFAGQQRFGSAVWSGDVQSSWKSLQAQIPAALDMSISGIPYWTSDIGGFYSQYNYPKGVKDAAFKELYVRWLQFGAFCSLMRSHGTGTPREIYEFGNDSSWAFQAIRRFINLRYRLLPYIYSTSWQVTSKGSTFMRALVMDFPEDRKVYNDSGEYMFGDAFLVSPVTEPLYTKKPEEKVKTEATKSWPVYLPRGADWFDFWTGKKFKGGQTIQRNVPVDKMPLYVKCGSVVPLGRLMQYSGQYKDSILELRIYPGADGSFTLYEDENDNYNYEKGKYSTIKFVWDDSARRLTIDARKGAFSGMLFNRVFNVVVVDGKHGGGMAAAAAIDKAIAYNGKSVSIYF